MKMHVQHAFKHHSIGIFDDTPPPSPNWLSDLLEVEKPERKKNVCSIGILHIKRRFNRRFKHLHFFLSPLSGFDFLSFNQIHIQL